MKLLHLSAYFGFLIAMNTSAETLASGPMLRPPPAMKEAGEYPVDLPFYQAVPMAWGALQSSATLSATVAGEDLAAVLKPLAYWPDGSVRWLGVSGLWPAKNPAVPAALTLVEGLIDSQDRSPEFTLRENESHTALVLEDAKHSLIATLVPSASVLPITLPKKDQPTDIDYLDREGQYSWAQPIGNLNANPVLQKLQPRIISSAREESNSLYDVQIFQGDYGATSPGHDLEWQLRAKVYHHTPIIQTEMTWIVRWPTQKYALASAAWKIISPMAWNEFFLPGASASTATTTVEIRTEANGSSVLIDGQAGEEKNADPSLARNGLVAVGATKSLSVGIPNFTRLGPNHLRGKSNTVEIALWSETSGQALDLRRSSDTEDFGIASPDLVSDGQGFSQTLRTTIAFFDTAEKSSAVARHAMRREDIWLPDASDLERTSALGPFQEATARNNVEYFSGLQANLLFLVRSRNHWKWSGLANFGDYRTNFAVGEKPERGLWPRRWALNGRYGWRNGSGDLSGAIQTAGLFFNNREITLAGIEQAEHVSDVDTIHASLFASKEQGLEGGIHRRNRDHWSGHAQMQYSPSEGLYLARWLTGDARLGDALKGLREFAKNDGGGTSPFAAQAWILRYMETRDVADRQRADALLLNAALFWKNKAAGTPLKGVAMLFARHDIRRVDNGLATLRLFHEATGDPVYLEAIRASIFYHKFDFPPAVPATLGVHGMLGYLLANDIQPDATETAFLKTAAIETQKFIPSSLPGDPSSLSYDALVDIVTSQLPPISSPAYRESNAIGERARSSFLALRYFGAGSPFLPTPPRKEANVQP